MDDRQFIEQLKNKVEKTAGVAIDFEIDPDDRRHLAVDFSKRLPRVIFGADVLKYPGLARMFSQYAILCLKERREISSLEFLLFLRRN